MREYWNHRFAVKLFPPRLWVRWGYETPTSPAQPMCVELATLVLDMDGIILRLTQKMSNHKSFESDGVKHVPKEVDRIRSWGWTLVNLEAPQGFPYTLAESREDCLKNAMSYIKRYGLIPDGVIYGGKTHWPKGWKELKTEAEAAVKSWMTGKGWPQGWRNQ